MFHYILLVLSLTIQGNQTILGRLFAEFIQNFMWYTENFFFQFYKKVDVCLQCSSTLSVQIQFIPDVDHLPSNYMQCLGKGTCLQKEKYPTTYPSRWLQSRRKLKCVLFRLRYSMVAVLHRHYKHYLKEAVFTFWKMEKLATQFKN